MATVKDLKQYLKGEVPKIRTAKAEMRKHPYDGQYTWAARKLSSNYRHHHIAYCLLRGKTLEQIEKPREKNEPDMGLVESIKEQYSENVCPSPQGS